ncbi:hypothetical protein O3V59_22310 [Brevibacillus thermoruber]|uniref:Uncharacterized protein n=1 Tax=Brevibacillus thermoruber TaxID=33942 RepID=A0A9X3TVH1_9BACL|nr:hypothetical protein [Brevibacillus thermoruber]MDA5111070.1 hypothetical protein [Brevibacillus thermoruber]
MGAFDNETFCMLDTFEYIKEKFINIESADASFYLH